ncbi:MAG: hypothetical protein FWD61_09540 [Phycisphaerales bacterium]|nr:hypothetical protein [Phycisphaerales bacterium]
MKIARVFPRRTNATPDDEMAFVGNPPLWAEADEVHISVCWTWDLPEAERLAKEWRHVAPVKIGGPATGMRSEEFVPGMYLKKGYVITSRGCPNRCWFCSVPKREGPVRELPIRDGWNVLDDNLIACSEKHIRGVFAMLARQSHRIEFTGGLEARRMKPWIAHELRKLKPKQVFFACDSPLDLEPLREAGNMMFDAGFTQRSHVLRCYVLCGYPRDVMIEADIRMSEVKRAGFIPMAMLYRDAKGDRDPEWMKFQKAWARPAIICSKLPWRPSRKMKGKK